MFAHLQGFRSWLAPCPKKAVFTQAFNHLAGLVRSGDRSGADVGAQPRLSAGIICAESEAAQGGPRRGYLSALPVQNTSATREG